MATISIPLYPGVTAGIDSFEIGTAFSGAKTAVNELIDALDSLKSKILSADETVDLDESWNDADSSEQREEIKESSLSLAYDKLDDLLTEIGRIDSAVAELINERKDDFYDEYDYLKPDCEKSDWELFWDDVGGYFEYLGEWLAENWESVVCFVVAVVVAAVIIIVCIATFGAAAVAVAALVGMALGLVGQLVSDLICYSITGEWQSSWQDYLGAAIGGAVGGALMLTGNPMLAAGVEAGIGTFFSGHLKNITGGEQKSFWGILGDTAFSVGLALAFTKVGDQVMGKLGKKLAKVNIFGSTPFRRLAGPGSYDASFKMILTKLSKGSVKNISYRTIRNGVISGLWGGTVSNGVNTILNLTPIDVGGFIDSLIYGDDDDDD